MSLSVLIVDDEPLARERLRTLLGDCVDPPVRVVGEAGNAVQAMEWVAREVPDALLLDIHMPGASGLKLAQTLKSLVVPPAVIFVTAHAEHAVQAFELEALDYLTKPVRLARLQAAMQKVRKMRKTGLQGQEMGAADEVMVIQQQGRAERLPLSEVLYLKAELKYVTVRTVSRSYIVDESLADLEARHPHWFLRVHRNALVARRAVRALEKHFDPQEGEGWAVRLQGVEELLTVSRRQVAAVREVIAA